MHMDANGILSQFHHSPVGTTSFGDARHASGSNEGKSLGLKTVENRRNDGHCHYWFYIGNHKDK
jgi:hypothetical protein